MSLPKAMLSKKKVSLYKAYILENGDKMLFKTDGDRMSKNINLSIEQLMNSIVEMKPESIDTIDSYKGKQVQVLELIFDTTLFSDNKIDCEYVNDKDIYIAPKDNRYVVKLHPYILTDFTYELVNDRIIFDNVICMNNK